MSQSRPSWFDDIDLIRLPPSAPEPEDPPDWTLFFPERSCLKMAWHRGSWRIRCAMCGKDLTRHRHPRKKEQVRDVWMRHIESRHHVVRALWIEENFLQYRLDKKIIRSVAAALEGN